MLARIDRSRRLLFVVALGFAAYGLNYGLIHSVTRIVDWPFASWMIWIRPYGAVITHSLLAHLPHFLLGVIGGQLFLTVPAFRGRNPGVSRSSDLVFWCACGAILVLLATPLGDLVQVPYGRYGLPVVPVLLLALVLSAPSSRIASRILQSRPLRQLGAISYGIYIYHLPCLTLTDRWLATHQVDAAVQWVQFGAISLALTILAATLSFRLIERPLQRLARRNR